MNYLIQPIILTSTARTYNECAGTHAKWAERCVERGSTSTRFRRAAASRRPTRCSSVGGGRRRSFLSDYNSIFYQRMQMHSNLYILCVCLGNCNLFIWTETYWIWWLVVWRLSVSNWILSQFNAQHAGRHTWINFCICKFSEFLYSSFIFSLFFHLRLHGLDASTWRSLIQTELPLLSGLLSSTTVTSQLISGYAGLNAFLTVHHL